MKDLSALTRLTQWTGVADDAVAVVLIHQIVARGAVATRIRVALEDFCNRCVLFESHDSRVEQSTPV